VQYRVVAFLLSFGMALPGCATNATFVAPNTQVENLAQENKGIVLVHTSLHEENCAIVRARLAKPDSSGRYVSTELINLKLATNGPTELSQIVLTAGDYGFVTLQCQQPRANRSYNSQPVQLGNIMDGSGHTYKRPIVTFSVQAGEVVDIGSLRLPVQDQRSVFSAVVTPTPVLSLQNLAASHPNLHGARVARLMKVPPPLQSDARSNSVAQ
jgi:hypothetical protein